MKKRKVFVIKKADDVEKHVKEATEHGCYEIARGVPRKFLNKVKEKDLPCFYEEEIFVKDDDEEQIEKLRKKKDNVPATIGDLKLLGIL